MTLNGYQYQWKDSNRNQNIQIGLLAQELEEVFPELVEKNEKGIMSVNYSGMIPILLDAIKEQQQQIDDLQKQVNSLKKSK